MPDSDQRYSAKINLILNNLHNNNIIIEDITNETVQFLTDFMDATARGKNK